MTKLEDLIVIAQNITYVEPTNTNIDNWNNDDLLYKSINIALQSEIQIRAGLYICNSFPPLKLVYKSILNNYIKHFSKMNKSD